MKLLIISVILVGLCVAGLAVKILFKKDGEFSGTCASQNPMLNKSGEPCSYCGKMPSSDCENSKAKA